MFIKSCRLKLCGGHLVFHGHNFLAWVKHECFAPWCGLVEDCLASIWTLKKLFR